MKFLPTPLFNLDAGGAPGDTGAAPAGGAPARGQPAAGASLEGNGAAPAPGLLAKIQPNGAAPAPNGEGGPKGYWPEKVPDDLAKTYRGQDDKGTIENLLKDITGRERAPTKPTDYKVELAPELAKKLGDLKDDPVLGVWREVAHKNGLTDKQFNGAISELYGQMLEKGLIEPPIDADKEIEKLMPRNGSPTQRHAEAANRINAVNNSIQGLVTNGTLTQTEGKRVLALAATADGVVTLEKLFKSMGEHGLQSGGAGAGEGITKESLKAQMADPRYNTFNQKYDAKFRATVDANWRRLHGAK